MKKTNCTVHGKQMYRVRAKIGEDLNGDPVFKSFYGDGKVEAERKRDEYIERHKNVKGTDKTFGQLAKYYTYNILINEDLSPGTIELYERQYRRYIESSKLSCLMLDDLSTSDLQHFLNDLDAKPSALDATAKFLKRFFKWLYRENLSMDMMYSVVPPKRPRMPKTDDISVFNDDEVRLIISKDNPLNFAFLLALSTGLRLGELLALRYSDFHNGAVSVKRQVYRRYIITSDGYKESRLLIAEPKSRTSIRTVPLPESVIKAFEEYSNTHAGEYVFTTESGKIIDRSDFRHSWKRHLNACGVPYKKFHACRATYCTLLCKNGVPLETAAKLMGHSDISVTAAFYRMVSDRELALAADRINDIFR